MGVFREHGRAESARQRRSPGARHLSVSDLEDLRVAFAGGGDGPVKSRVLRAASHAIFCKECRELLYTYVLGAELEKTAGPDEKARAFCAAEKPESASVELERGKNGLRVVSISGLAPGGFFKGLPPRGPLAAVSGLCFAGETGSSRFGLDFSAGGRSLTISFPNDPLADVDAGSSASVFRAGPGRFRVDVAELLDMTLVSGSGESLALTVAASDVPRITHAPALLAIYADSVSGASGLPDAVELAGARAASVEAAGGADLEFFSAALESLTLSSAPLFLHLGGAGPTPAQRGHWKEILQSLAIAGHLAGISALPGFENEKDELGRIFDLVTDGLVHDSQRRLEELLSRLADPLKDCGPSAQAGIYLYSLNGWLLVCKEKHEMAMDVFEMVLRFHRLFPLARLAPHARSAHYFADIGVRTAALMMRLPDTPFHRAVFDSILDCLA